MAATMASSSVLKRLPPEVWWTENRVCPHHLCELCQAIKDRTYAKIDLLSCGGGGWPELRCRCCPCLGVIPSAERGLRRPTSGRCRPSESWGDSVLRSGV